MDDAAVFDVVEHFDGVGRRGLGGICDLGWKGKGDVEEVAELEDRVVGEVLENGGHLTVCKLSDELLCFVGVGFEGLNYVTGNIVDVFDYVAFFRTK